MDQPRPSIKGGPSSIVSPKCKRKILRFVVADIKKDIVTDYKAGDVIAEIDAETAEKTPFIFGKGPDANIKFS